MWNIDGKIYDLTTFLDKHPGGRLILESCYGEDDLTGSFESYHAMCDMKKIKTIMKQYEVGICHTKICTFKEDGFYNVLRNRVKNKLNNNYKANNSLVFKVLIQTLIFLCSFVLSFYYYNNLLIYRIILAVISGNFLVQIGFTSMHDASHMAISKNKHVNEVICNIWNSIALWDSQLWIKHHVIKHHLFTGIKNNDPDLIHYKPFIKKIKGEKCSYVLNSYYQYFIFFILLPGSFIGQSILYNLFWVPRKRLWKMSLSYYFKISIWQTFIKLFMIYSFYYSGSFAVVYSYFISLNFTYCIMILPDHDTIETNNNKLINYKDVDWGELQVRHSGNFSNNNFIVSMLYGGINYQIEHHLFPTICHVHFEEIKPIVKDTCKEFNIPYVEHYSIYSALKSVFTHFIHVNQHP